MRPARAGAAPSRLRRGGATPKRVGWLMGFEPTTTGITIRDSTAELQPPPLQPLRPAGEAAADRAPPTVVWRARQDSNLLPPA